MKAATREPRSPWPWIAGGLAAAAAAYAYTRYARDLHRAERRLEDRSLVAQTASGPVEYADHGHGHAVLVAHGAGGGFDQGMEFAGALVRGGARVIAVSRFGYLRTPLPRDASPQAQADAYAALLDTLGVETAAIVGASAGAPSAMQFAIRHPQRCSKLVLVVPAAYVPREGEAPSVRTPPATHLLFDTALRSDLLFWAATKLAAGTMYRSILATLPEVVGHASPREQRRVAAMLEHILPVSRRRRGLENDAGVTSTLARYELEKIAVPTLAISLADDRFGTYDAARYTAEHIPGARFVGFERGGHVWAGHHEEILSLVRDFLS